MTNRGFLVAAGTLVVANVLIFGGVMRNRAGNPDAVVRLSERELESWGDHSEGAETFLNLRLQWKTAPGPGGKPWFNRAKLEALGNIGIPAADDTAAHREWSQGTKPGYAVLELAGPAWERWREAAPLKSDSIPTRLMAVDFGLDPLALRQQYPERSQYLILPATYHAIIVSSVRDSMSNTVTPARIEGQVRELLPGTVHVPRPLRDSLIGLGAELNDSTTHFEVTLKVGRKWEVWVE